MPHPLVCDLYLSVSGQFRTESTCKYRIKDKKVSALRKELEERRRQHLQIEKIKEAKRQRFEAGMVVKRSEFERLKARSLHLASCLRRLDIRRDQISARQDSSISQAKCRVLRTYLLSLAYTVGDKYELIRKFGGMKNYLKMKVLIMHLETRRAVAQSISSILYMRIVPFEGQTMVLCIKQLGRGDKSYERVRIVSSLNPSQYSRTLFDEGVEICVYAVTGTNFCLKKVYNFEQLYKFADQLEEKLAPKSVAETREARFGVPKKRRKHRPSVAEYLLTRIRL